MSDAWEYMIYTLEPPIDEEGDATRLDELADKGWELVAVCPEARRNRSNELTFAHVAYFKRRKAAT